MNGYKEAEKIEEQLYKLMMQYPIRLNYKAWAALCRTLNSTASILLNKTMEEWKKTVDERR